VSLWEGRLLERAIEGPYKEIGQLKGERSPGEPGSLR